MHIKLNNVNIGDKGLVILIENLKVVSFLSLIGNDIHSLGVSCLADAAYSGKLKLRRDGELRLSDNPLGLKGSIAVARIISSSHWQALSWIGLSRCELTTAGINLSSTESLNTISSVTERDIEHQLYQMPQSSSISVLDLSANSFTGEGIHILAGFIHLCPCMKLLNTIYCGITSDDFIWLLNKLTQLKSSSFNHCSKLETWHLENNLLDDIGVSALINHLPSLFPRLTCKPFRFHSTSLHGNPVSSEMKKRLEEESRRRLEEVGCCSS